MSASDYRVPARSGGAAWIYAPVVLVMFLGAALSVAAYFYSDQPLTIAESIAAGFGGVAGIILGLLGALFGVVVGLLGGLFGLAVGGGAIALTMFILASPVIAIVLIFLLMRKNKTCPDPAAHQ
ncbi:MAG: hypothetical protein R3C58_15890 [Parvularculaceae bacterium]